MNQVATRPESSGLSATQVGIATGRGSKIAPQNLGEVVRFAEVMSRADIALPKHLRGNAGACMAVALQALEWEMSPFAVASKSYAVNGQIAYEAQLIAAVVNTRSGIEGRLKYTYEGEGDAMKCTVVGKLDGEILDYESPEVGSIPTKNSPLWKADPKQQLGYYSARAWARRHTPEVILGVYAKDEMSQMKDITPTQPAGSLTDRLAAARSEQPEPASEGFDLDHVNMHASAPEDADWTEANAEPETPADDAPLHEDWRPDDEGELFGEPDAEPEAPAEPGNTDLAEFKAALAACGTPEAINAINKKYAPEINKLSDDVKAEARAAVAERRKAIGCAA